MILAIDPGNDTGWAMIDKDELVAAGVGMPHVIPYNHTVMIECPQIYPHGGKGDPNDLIKLAVMVGRYQERYERLGNKVVLVKPAQWKGQVPKHVTEKRVREKFPEIDRVLVDIPKGKRHNAFDAIGLAMWAAERNLDK